MMHDTIYSAQTTFYMIHDTDFLIHNITNYKHCADGMYMRHGDGMNRELYSL